MSQFQNHYKASHRRKSVPRKEPKILGSSFRRNYNNRLLKLAPMMKKRETLHHDCMGFTLLEVIITLVIAAIFGSMLIQFTGTSMSRSADTVERVRNGSTLVRTVEAITKDYRSWIKSNPDDPLINFKNTIDASYGGGNIAVQTVFSDVDSGMDTDIEILWVTVSELDENLNVRQSLVTLFTR